MKPCRRTFLSAAAVTSARLVLGEEQPSARPARMGIGISSYAIRSRKERAAGFAEPLTFLTFCHERGAAGVQVGLGVQEADAVRKLRAKAEQWGMYLEGSVRIPRDRSDLARFEAEARTAKAAGAKVLRTVLLNGRRYETFRSAEDYRAFTERSWQSVQLAAPVVERVGIQLAIENHKDQRAEELVAMLRRLASEHVGTCVDTGNNLALLEEPLETVKILAPWAMSCHLKDMGVEEYPQGFLLSEVALGDGFLDLSCIVETLRKARPEVRFSLEMITRDPLKIPCLTREYWATMGDVPGRDLAGVLATARKQGKKLPRLSNRSEQEQLAAEEENVRKSLVHAREKLPL